jgi:hypothetical protein
VNISVRAGVAYSLMVTHCLLSNPLHLRQVTFLDVHEGQSQTKEDSALLSHKLINKAGKPVLVIFSVVIDNRAARAPGLGLSLS